MLTKHRTQISIRFQPFHVCSKARGDLGQICVVKIWWNIWHLPRPRAAFPGIGAWTWDSPTNWLPLSLKDLGKPNPSLQSTAEFLFEIKHKFHGSLARVSDSFRSPGMSFAWLHWCSKSTISSDLSGFFAHDAAPLSRTLLRPNAWDLSGWWQGDFESDNKIHVDQSTTGNEIKRLVKNLIATKSTKTYQN